MNCREVLDKISAYMDNELEPAASRTIASHLETCAACREEFDSLSAMDALVRDLPRYEVPASFARETVRKMQRMHAPAQRTLAQRAAALLLNIVETFSGPPSADRDAHVLEEFDDIPESFIGHAYFRILA